MPLFGKAAPAPSRRAPLQVLRADGQRLDLTKRTTGAYLAATRQKWQTDAWAYRNLIGELRYAQQLLAQGVARVRFYPAAIRPHPEDPASLDGDDHGMDEQLAADAVANFRRLPMDSDPDGFTARLVENLSTPGEAWIHGREVDGVETWAVRSTSEVLATQDKVQIRTLPAQGPGGGLGAVRDVDPRSEELLRCWRADPEWADLADSPLRALLDVAEDVVLAGREQRSAARSRLAANGVFLIPDTLTFVKDRSEDDVVDDSVTSDTFLADFIDAILSPVTHDGDPHGVVPVVLRGAAEDLEKVRHVTMARADSEDLIERQAAALVRLLRGLDIQPEQVEGTGTTNHWNAWSIEANSVRHQIDPMAKIVASCLTKAFLRPALLALDHPRDKVEQVVIVGDSSGLVENINRGQDARDAHAAMVLSDEALLDALGFDKNDMPDEAEWQRRMAAKSGLTPDVAAAVLDLQKFVKQAQMLAPQRREVINVPSTREPAAVPAGDTARPAQPGQSVPEKTAPAEPSETVVAAAAPDPTDGWLVEVDLARRLADIDADLRDKLVIAGDAAVARVLDRAGARIRSKAQADRQLAASLTGMDAHLIAGTVGADRVASLGLNVPELLADSYARLRGQWLGWVRDAIRAVSDAVLALLHVNRRSDRGRRIVDTIETRLSERTEQTWKAITAVLDDAAERALFTPDPFTPVPAEQGEDTRVLVRPKQVARALSVAGGGDGGLAVTDDEPMVEQQRDEPAGGLGTGPIIREVITQEGGVLLGHEWQYRPGIPRRTFPPHLALDGTRFGTWTDPKLDTDARSAWIGPYFRPQDHDGCLCSSSPIWAVPELDDGVVERRLREARERNRLSDELAEGDDRAGRVGTSAQREREVRDRLIDGVEQLRRQHVTNHGGPR